MASRHWRSARGWSRRAMVPLVWLAGAVVIERIVGVQHRSTFFKPGQLRASPAGNAGRPVLFVISTVRARTAGGALGTAIVDLGPGASRPGSGRRSPGRWATRRCESRSAIGESGYLDTAGRAVDMDRPGPGRVVTRATGSDEAVLVYDEGLALEPQLVELDGGGGERGPGARPVQAEVRPSWSRSVSPGHGSSRPGTPSGAGWNATCTMAPTAAGDLEPGPGDGPRPGGAGGPGTGVADRVGQQGSQGGADPSCASWPAGSIPPC